MKKKICAAVLAMCMMLAASGCTDSDKAKESSTEAGTQQEPEKQEEEQSQEEADAPETE